MGASWLVSTWAMLGRGIIAWLFPTGPDLYSFCTRHCPGILVWDIQTGFVIKDIESEITGNITFSGNHGIITLVKEEEFFIYDGLNGGRLYKGQLQLPNKYQSYAQCTHKESLQFATSLKTNGRLTINIQELQPISNPLCLTIKSYPVPLVNGKLSFSPVSFHASFATTTEVVVLDVQGSKILFHTKVDQPLHNPPGQFSPDGSFLACETLDHNIFIWRNTPTGYVPWSTLQPRLPFDEFSFSPTANSVLTWGPEGIEVLHPENSATSPFSNKTNTPHRGKHLVAYSADGTHIAMARQEGGVVTVLNSLSGALLQSIHVSMHIQAIGIVGDTILLAGGDRLTTWDLGTGEGAAFSGSHDITAISSYMDWADRLALSNDHSQFAFAKGAVVVLYSMTAQAIVTKHRVDQTVLDIQFSQDGHSLYVHSFDEPGRFGHTTVLLTTFEMARDGCSASVTKVHLEDRESHNRFTIPSCGYHITESKWVMDSGGCKHLWLPPNWRSKWGLGVRIKGNFLSLVGSHHQEPIIIKLQP